MSEPEKVTSRQRDAVARIAAMQAAHNVRVDNQGKPLEPLKPQTYDHRGHMIAPADSAPEPPDAA
ncbi:hypothetical protein [Nocardia sp. NPDC004604]|uniref:hypothetical protein n=1 Tax=Nocardia sp. NPDC004604 TaxID=3157013 RepID=UPI0033A3F9EF